MAHRQNRSIHTGWICDVTTSKGIVELAKRHRDAAERMMKNSGRLQHVFTAYCTADLTTGKPERSMVHLLADGDAEMVRARALIKQACDIGEAAAVVTVGEAYAIASNVSLDEVERWRATHGGIKGHPNAVETAVLAIESRLGNVLLMADIVREGQQRKLGRWAGVESPQQVHGGLFGLLPDSARMPPAKCVCGSEVDAATSLGHRSRPKPGDFSVCAVCARLMVFAPDFSLREVEPGELSLLDRELRDRLIAAQGVIRQERLPGKPWQRGQA